MQTARLGSQGLETSRLGLGCMGMSDFYGSRNDEESIKTLHRSLEIGISFWDTADMYGPYTNEVLVGKALKGKRQQVTLATKFGIVRDASDHSKRGFNGSPAYVKEACEASLQRLGVEVIDLYYLHRVDPATPIEDTVGAMANLISEGKIRAIGLSEVSADTLMRAHSTYALSAVQSEYSLWTRDPEDGILELCRVNGIAFVAYSPLGRGFLTGQIQSPADFEKGDYRHISPRFQGENFAKNLELVKRVKSMAEARQCTASQLALAWVLSRGSHVFPIPGTKHVRYLEENAAAVDLKLTPAELDEIEQVFPRNAAAGMRYPENMMASLNR